MKKKITNNQITKLNYLKIFSHSGVDLVISEKSDIERPRVPEEQVENKSLKNFYLQQICA